MGLVCPTMMVLPVGTTAAMEEEITSQPNTALLSLILTLGTFAIASYLKSFKSSHYLGKTVGHLLFKSATMSVKYVFRQILFNIYRPRT